MGDTILDANELITQSTTRTFYQPGGAGQPAYFFGVDSEYHFIDGANMPTNGDIAPVFVPDPRRARRWRLASRTFGPPELPTVDLVFLEKWGGIPRILTAPKCVFNLYEIHSSCADLSDFYRGWAGSYLLIYAGFLFSGPVDLGTRTSREGDDPLSNSASAMGTAIYPVGQLSFGEEAATDVVVEVIDAVYGSRISCGDCPIVNDGSDIIYAVTRANVGSPAAPGQLLYTLDGGATWTTATITGIGAAAEVRYIDLAGDILLVGTSTTALFYTRLNADTGAPTTWSSVTLPVAMNDVYVQSPGAIFFAADTGRVYRTTSITTAPTLIDSGATDNLLRISGDGEGTIVAVGANGRVYRSLNSGKTWASLTAPAATSLNAVVVRGARSLLVGGANGILYRTRNAGGTWETAYTTGGAIHDIVQPTPEVVWVSYAVSSIARLLTTLDGGQTWATNADTDRIINWPVFQRGGRLAVPQSDSPAINANHLTVCGLAASGADGILLNAAPTIV